MDEVRKEIAWHRAYLHPRDRGETLEYILAELLGREVAIFEQRAGFDFDIADGAKFLYQGAEWVKGADGLREARRLDEETGKSRGWLT